MIDLNDENSIKEADKGQVVASIQALPSQISQAWGEARKVQFPADYRQVKNILIDGMGGSGLGPELIAYVYRDQLKAPLTVLHDYNLPAFADSNTLVIISSYSGTTEEPLNLVGQALAADCKITAVTEGRDLGDFLTKNNLPGYIFKATANPSEQPRFGLGYSVAGILGLLEALGLLTIGDSEISATEAYLKSFTQNLAPNALTSDNKVKSLATALSASQIAVVSGEFLSGNAHIFANQINENAKNFADYFLLSELDHHLLEGLGYPLDLKSKLNFVLLNSPLYSEKIAKRLGLTKEILEKQGYQNFIINFEASTKLAQAFEGILISSWTSFYLGLLNGVDPAKIPWVDYFKETLAKG